MSGYDKPLFLADIQCVMQIFDCLEVMLLFTHAKAGEYVLKYVV